MASIRWQEKAGRTRKSSVLIPSVDHQPDAFILHADFPERFIILDETCRSRPCDEPIQSHVWPDNRVSRKFVYQRRACWQRRAKLQPVFFSGRVCWKLTRYFPYDFGRLHCRAILVSVRRCQDTKQSPLYVTELIKAEQWVITSALKITVTGSLFLIAVGQCSLVRIARHHSG